MLDTLEEEFSVPEPQQPATHGDIAALRQEMSEQFVGLRRLINGDPESDTPGIRPRLARIEEKLSYLPNEHDWYAAKQRIDLFPAREWHTYKDKLDILPTPREWQTYKEKLDALPTPKEWGIFRQKINIGTLMLVGVWGVVIAITIAVILSAIGGP